MKSTSQATSMLAHEVGQEEDGALEHADQQQVLALVVARDLRPSCADAVLQVVGLDEDLADALRASGAQSSGSRQASRTRCAGRRP